MPRLLANTRQSRGLSIRARIQAWLLVAVLPLASIPVFDAYVNWRRVAAEAGQAAESQARLVASNVAALIDGARPTLAGIALRAQDEALDGSACAAYLSGLVAGTSRYASASVVTPRGQILCHSEATSPSLPLARGDLAAALGSRTPVIGSLAIDDDGGRAILPLALSYRDAVGRVLGAAVLTLDLEGLVDGLPAARSTERGFAAIVDREGTVAARSPDRQGWIARPMPTLVSAMIGGADTPGLVEVEHEGRTYIAGWAPIQAGLAALVGFDRAAMLAGAETILARNLVLAAAGSFFALVVGWIAGWRLVQRPIRGFVQTAQRRVAGEANLRFAEDDANTEYRRLGEALNAMASELERHVDQKVLLVREVQHRVMNSLHLLGAILHLHARQVDNEVARRHLNEARQRVASMSMVYRHLCERNESARSVEFAGMLRAFCEEVADAYLNDKPAALEVDAEPMDLPVEAAMSLALITHELVTNAMKHAYGGEGGPLRVEFRRDGNLLELAVTDWGKGLPAGFSAERSASLGMIVIQSLTRQLRGRLTAEALATGTRFTVVVLAPGAPDTAPAHEGPERLVA